MLVFVLELLLKMFGHIRFDIELTGKPSKREIPFRWETHQQFIPLHISSDRPQQRHNQEDQLKIA